MDEGWEKALQDIPGLARERGLVFGKNASLVPRRIQDVLDVLRRSPREKPWGGYLVADNTTSKVVATCVFAAPPRDGSAEFFCFLFPGFEKGHHHVSMLRHLAQIAFSRQVQTVICRSSPGETSWTQALERAGFRRAGDTPGAADGAVWRWELRPENPSPA